MKKLLFLLKKNKLEAILAPAFKMLEAIFELLVPLAVAHIIDVGLKNKDTTVVFSMCGVMIALGVIGLICAISAQYFSAKAAVNVATKLRSSLFAHIQSFSYAKSDEIGTSTLITRMTGDINSVQTGINMTLRLFLRSPFIVFGAMIMAFTINPRLSTIFAVTILLLSVIVFGIMLISMPLYKKIQSALDGVLGKVRSNYTGTRVIRAFNKEADEIEDFTRKHEKLTAFQRFAGMISALMNPLTYVMINFAVIVLIRNGALAVNSGDITQGELIALYNYMSQILVELIKLANLIITINKAAASASRINLILDTPIESPKAVEKESSDKKYIIEFDNVSFSYSKTGDPALSNISFGILPGETVGIIGGTGAGKSTLVNLIPGFYQASIGSVFVNGKNAALYEKQELTDLIAVVPQKAMLFKGTVRSNLHWGKNDADDKEMWEALRLAQAADFIEQKEGKLDEAVAQNGSNFSGGQRQRLTIARALIKKPQILILDDSASALDYVTEAELRRSIKSLEHSPTVFIVSQRTSSIMHADKIIVLDDGIMIGMGTHEELLESCEVYREIYSSQFSEN